MIPIASITQGIYPSVAMITSKTLILNFFAQSLIFPFLYYYNQERWVPFSFFSFRLESTSDYSPLISVELAITSGSCFIMEFFPKIRTKIGFYIVPTTVRQVVASLGSRLPPVCVC